MLDFVKILTYTGHTNIFNRPNLYKYSLKIVDDKRVITEYNYFNDKMIVSDKPLSLGYLENAIKPFIVLWCNSIKDLI